MHCPNCGKPATAEQQFCRACGMNLRAVGELVAAHSGSPERTDEKAAKAAAEKEILGRMVSWMGWGMFVMGIGVLMLVTAKYFPIGRLFSLVAVLLLLGGVGIATAGLFRAMREGAGLRAKGLSDSKPDTKELAQGSPTKYMPEERVPVPTPSVTERTTQLIERDEE